MRRAQVLWDSSGGELPARARVCWRTGFTGGGEWMRAALGVLRQGRIPTGTGCFQFLGIAKYGLAGAAAVGVLLTGQWWAVPLGILVFYLVEAQLVFLFPLTLDGSARRLDDSRQLTLRAGGMVPVTWVVMKVAAMMLLRGFGGQGFVRSWGLGCLEILIWYEELRVAARRRARGEIGESQPLLVRAESVNLTGGRQPLRLVYASDLHFRGNGSNRVADQLVEAVRTVAPELILFGGDLVESGGGLSQLATVTARLSKLCPVWAISGNHDQAVGIDAVCRAVESGGGGWLECGTIQSGNFRIDGAVRSGLAESVGRILCCHDPRVVPAAELAGYGLVLAGHLHGGQCVFFQRGGKFYPGALFYRWNGLRFIRGRTTVVVSRGVSDTVRLRWNCPREIVLCEIY